MPAPITQQAATSAGSVRDRIFRRLLAVLFLALALPLGLVLATVTPPGHVPDEVAHMQRSLAIAGGKFAGRRVLLENPGEPARYASGVVADPAMLWVVTAVTNGRQKVEWSGAAAARFISWWGRRVFMSIGPIAVYAPEFYLPSGAAVATVRAFHGTPFDAIEAGRLVNLAVFLAVGGAALLVARRAHALLFCVLTTPMSLSLAASFNQDGLLIAAAVLAAALLGRSLEPGLPAAAVARHPGYWLAAVLILLIAAAKPPYMPLAAMLLVPLPRPGAWRTEWPAMRLRLWAVALVVLPTLAWTIFAMATIATPVSWPTYPAGPLWPGDPNQVFTFTRPNEQLRVLAAHPLELVELVWDTLRDHGRNLVWEGIGILGFLTVMLPTALYNAWLAAFGAATLAGLIRRDARPPWFRPRPPGGLGWMDAALLLGGALACFWAIYISQYLTWTKIGSDLVEGPTGRYLLPLIPMAALALPRFEIPRGRAVSAGLTLAPVLVALAGLAVVPHVIVDAWYLR